MYNTQHRLRFLPQRCKSYTKLLFALIVVVGITACGGGGGGGGAATKAPLPPTNLTATPNSASQMTINWAASAGASSYKVYRSTSIFANSIIIEPSLATTSYVDTGLMAGTQYHYWLKACKNVVICSNYSTEIAATTASLPPTSLTATPNSASQITIKWSVSTDADYYIVNRSTSIFANSIIIESSLATTSYVDTGLMAGTQYHYWLKACKNVAICSNYSIEIAATTAPLPPISLTATPNSASQITINWAASAGASSYKVYRSTSSTLSNSTPIDTAVETTHTDTGLIAETQYYYWLKACNTGDICSAYSAQIATATLAPPAVPTSLTATPNSVSQITIKWSVLTDADYYIVNRSTSIFANSIIIESSLATTSYVDTGLMAGTQYHYWLKACKNVAICSNYSTEIAATTVPLPPTSLSAVASTNQITIDWIGSTGAGYYSIYGSTNSFASDTFIEDVLPGVLSYTDATLTANTQYYYWIKACNTGTICSEYSAKKSVRTLSLINDTGIIWSGDYPSGNNSDCSGANTIAEQDCSSGRDAEATVTLAKIGGGMAGFDFTKLGQNGNDLTIQNATWGVNSGSETAGTRWSCVRDNHTGLIWEVKNNDGNAPAPIGSTPTVSSDNIHHKDNKYRWGGLTADGRGVTTVAVGGEYYDDWNSLVEGTNNSEALCGFSDWRVPFVEELKAIVNKGRTDPAIDQNYFPHVERSSGVGIFNSGFYYFWSSSPDANNNDYAWYVDFTLGLDGGKYERSSSYRVWLVRGGQ